ncbi:MAG: hypothetical protein JXR10_10665 [Cyclobacteriaceae bacterium]
MKFRLFLIATIMVLGGGHRYLFAQDQNYTHFTLRSGIPTGFISTIVEDRYGYIWIGTTAGMSKFDGYSFENNTQKVKDSTTLKGSYICRILDYNSSTMIVATTEGLNVFDRATESFRLVSLSDSLPTLSDISDVLQMTNGDLWVLSKNGYYLVPAEELDSEIADVSYYEFAEPTREGSARMGKLLYDGGNFIWSGSDYSALQKFDINAREFVPLGDFSKEVEAFMSESIWDMLFDSLGTLYIAGDLGFLEWKKDESPQLINPGGALDDDKLRFFQSVNLDSEGRLLIGTGESGGIRWNSETNEVDVFQNDASDVNTVNSNDVHYMFEDSNNNMWFGYHFLGLSMMYFNSLDYSYKDFGEELNMTFDLGDIFNLAEDEQGNLWFPTAKGLIKESIVDGSLKLFELKDAGVLGAIVINQNKIYLSAFDDRTGSIYSFDIQKEKFNNLYASDKFSSIPLATETEDFIYFSSLTGGQVMRLDKATDKTKKMELPKSEILGGNRIIGNFLKDVDGNLIAETYYVDEDLEIETFLYDEKNETYQEVTIDRDFPAVNRIVDMASRVEPMVIWSRNQYGLAKYDLANEETNVYFQGEPVIQENPTGAMVEDNDGYIWMNNATGIMRLDPVTGEIAQYEIKKEYRPEVFLRPVLLKNGDIIFSAANGYIRFNPAQTQLQLSVENLHLTEFKVNDQTYNLLYQPLPESFSYDNNDISISYLGFNYLDPTGTNYRYRVKGFNEDWTYMENQRRVFLANLPYGKFEFEVQAATKHGSYNTSRTLPLVIRPPWYLTWWAYVLYASLFVLFALYGYRMQKIRTIRMIKERNRDRELAQAKEIEKAYNQLQNTQKQLIHAEKMASLGELTAGIAHEIQNPLNFVNNFADINRELIEEQKEEIEKKNYEEVSAIADDIKSNEEKIIHHGKRAEEIVKSMLMHSRGSEGNKERVNINGIADEYLRLSYHGLRAKDKSFNADFKLHLDDTLPEIEVIPQDIGRVFLNLINNAFHATTEKARNSEKGYAPTVELSTMKNGEHIQVIIQDNGPGIPESIREKIFQPFFTTKAAGSGTGLGLSLSYDIVTKGHGGTISVESEEGKGTKFIIELPIK